MISDDILLSRAMADAVREHPDAAARDAGSQHHDIPVRAGRSSAARWARSRPSGTSTQLNEALLDRVQRSGEAFVSNAVVHGRYVLRACIVNFHTGLQDVEALLEIVTRFGRELDRERRPAPMR